ncbi:MAG: signal peptidase I [Bacteroidales bacterium]|nr:signal peptidase I [Bacteroidales bacterium]
MAETKKTEVTTVTTTTVTTTTTKNSGEGHFWTSWKPWVKVLACVGAFLLVAAIVLYFIFARNTPKSNTMEGTIERNTTLLFNKQKTPEKGDVVLFWHPEADSIVPSSPDKNYYKMCRLYGKAWCSKAEVVSLNKKRRPVYASRVVAVPGDVVSIKNNVVYVNNQPVEDPKDTKYHYIVVSEGYLNSTILDSLNLTKESMDCDEEYPETYLAYYRNIAGKNSSMALYSLTQESADKLAGLSMIKSVQKVALPAEHYDPLVFPYEEPRHWNASNFGPVLVPVQGKVLKLTTAILPIYRRIIEVYEGNTLEVKNNVIYINGKEANSYKFKRNYYFVLGDNRTSKDDSRYFGFLLDQHVKGVVIQ